MSRQLARVSAVAFFRLRCCGREHWPSSEGVLVCSNHQSYLDPVIVGLCCDRQLNYLARRSLFKFAPFRWLIRWFDAIPIERDGLGIGGLKETIRRLRGNQLVLVFPEGTRTSNGQLSELKPGFCSLVRRTAVPIVPVGIDGAFQSWPRGTRWPRLTPVHVCIGQPILPEKIGSLTDTQLVEYLRTQMQQCLETARQGRGRASLFGKPRRLETCGNGPW